MSDLGWYLAGALGFALMCVIGVVWLLSKRSVNVTQVQENHAAPVVVHAGESGGGLGLAPALIGGAFKMLTAGIVLTLVVNLAIAAFSGLGAGLQSIGNGLSQQASSQPKQIVVNYPTAQPVPTTVPLPTAAPVPTAQPVPVYVPVQIEPDLLQVVVGVLAVVALGLWGYVAVTLWQRRSIKRPNVVTPTGYTHPAFDAAAKNVRQKAGR